VWNTVSNYDLYFLKEITLRTQVMELYDVCNLKTIVIAKTLSMSEGRVKYIINGLKTERSTGACRNIGNKRISKLNNKHILVARRFIRENSGKDWGVRDLQSEINKNFPGLVCSLSTVHRFLITTLKYRYRKTKRFNKMSNTKVNKSRRQLVSLKMMGIFMLRKKHTIS
jgi:hypothetical protein